MQLPAREHALDIRLAAGPRDHEHPLLGLAEHDLVRDHARRAARDAIDIDPHADPAAGSELARRTGEPRRAEVLDRLDRVERHELQRRFEEQLLDERVADLDRRARP